MAFTKMILYSSNPEDLICDFFLGSFSTAKIAIGLGRNACGFELNKNAYNYQIKEIEKIKKGDLLNEMRNVPENLFTNKGKPLHQKEIDDVVFDFKELINKGKTKKDALATLTQKYRRGFFSIEKIITSISGEKMQTGLRFE